MSHGPKSFGERLRQLRSAASLSQEELAERAGLSVRGISDLERGLRHAPRLETVRMLADALTLGEDERALLLAAARPTRIQDISRDLAPNMSVSLPTPLTQLIGREQEVAALLAMLESDTLRLLTVTGAGGSGKTRLAVEVAANARQRFADGVIFVDLSVLTDAVLVLPTIAAAVGVREVSGQPLRQTLASFFASRELLLILDSCEQVLAAAPDIAALLSASPDLVILATSREPLHVRGEREFPLLPLPLPPSGQAPMLPDLAQIPAITLFIERAQANRPDFSLTLENATSVSTICRRLDGLPLAIELAAARIKALPPAALLARLNPRLPLLTGGRDLPARQRTMRDTIAWSYDLLTPALQALFRRLAVFTGDFSLAAAEAIAGDDDAGSVVDGVVALVEQSLLRQVLGTDEDPRYQMLETVREFGLEQLGISGEVDDARRRHAAFFLQLSGEYAYGSLVLMDQERLNHVAADHDNVRLGLSWFDGQGQSDELLRLSAMLYGLWFARGLYSEGLLWAERALTRSRHVVSAGRVQALDGAAMLAILQGDYARAGTFLEEGLALAHTLNDPFLVGEATAYSGFLAYRLGDYARAEHQLEEGLDLMRGVAESVHWAWALLIMGDTALVQEQFDRAAISYQEAIDRFQEAGFAWGLSDAQAGLAGVHFATGDLAEAAAHYAASLERAWRLGFPMWVASSLHGLAAVAAASGLVEEGAHLLGAAEGMIADLGAPMFPRDKPILMSGLSMLTATLGEGHVAGARQTGQLMTTGDAISKARSVAATIAMSTRSS